MSVQSKLEYLTQKSERPIYHASISGRNARHSLDQPTQAVAVEVHDARDRNPSDNKTEFGMHESGFDLFNHESAVQDFLDQVQIKDGYETEIEGLLKSVTGCYRVHIFDHTVRASDPEVRELKQIRESVSLVHGDYTSGSGFVCLQENLGDEAAELSKGRFQIINVWRPLVDPVEDFPLALCDLRSVSEQDLVDTERRAPNHTGELQLAVHSPAHRWFYYPGMRPDEVLLFKTFDSINGGHSPCSIHSAIKLPDAATDARPRVSIETRAFLFY